MSLKIKLISCISLFMLMIGVLIIGVFAATQQQLTMEGSVSFNVPDKSLYVKDVRIKQDMASEPTSIDSFMPGYINGDFTLDLTGITDTNTYGSFSLYFDIINTTNSQWEIVDVELPTALTNAGVSASYSGVIPTNDLTDTDSDGYKNFDASTPIDGSLILTITAPNSDIVNLEGIVVTIDEQQPNIMAISSNETLGIAQGAFAEIGDDVTISADFTGNADADFLGWRAESEDGELVSTLSDYTFTYTEESPTTYYAIFEEPNLYLTFDNLTEGEARLRRCEEGAIDIIVPSEIYRTSQSASYVVTSLYSAISSSSGVFYRARSTLQSVSLPETITSIGSAAFYDCSGLTSITLPSSLESIGFNAFYDCSGLETMNYLGTPAEWCAIEFGNSSSNPTSYTHSLYIQGEEITELVIPEGVISIGDYAFYRCSGLTSITLPSSLESIGTWAFYNCSGLTSITLPENVTSIGNSAFQDCSGLTSITLPSSLESIGSSAFRYCNGLTSITLPSSLTSIGNNAFQNCNSLATVYIDSETIANGITSSTSYGNLTFYATTLYIKDTITVTTVPSGWVEDSTGSGQVSGYNKYIKA